MKYSEMVHTVQQFILHPAFTEGNPPLDWEPVKGILVCLQRQRANYLKFLIANAMRYREEEQMMDLNDDLVSFRVTNNSDLSIDFDLREVVRLFSEQIMEDGRLFIDCQYRMLRKEAPGEFEHIIYCTVH